MKHIALIISFLILPTLTFGFEQVELRSKFGQRGSGPGQLKEPMDIAVDSEGIIYVADQGNKQVHVLGKDGRTIATWKHRSVDRWKLDKPTGVAVYENRVYVTDSYHDKILIFFKNGKFVDEFGGSGSGPKKFSKPQGICVHQGVVYVADTGNHRVQKFSLDGIYLGSIGKKGDGIGEMKSPTDVAVDHKGYIYVAKKITTGLGSSSSPDTITGIITRSRVRRLSRLTAAVFSLQTQKIIRSKNSTLNPVCFSHLVPKETVMPSSGQ